MFKRLDTLEPWQVVGLIDFCRRELVRLVDQGMDPDHPNECALFLVAQLETLEAEAAKRGIPLMEEIPEV